MTQTKPTPDPRLTRRPVPGTTVRLRTGPETGTVVDSDDFMDTLRLRGISASNQVLVEWQIDGRATRIWERITHLEPVLSEAGAELPPQTGEKGTSRP